MQFINTAIGARGGASFRTKLDGVEFRIDLQWNPIEEFWALSLYTSAAVLLLGGVTLRHGENVLAPFSGDQWPGGGLGRLKAWDTTNRDGDPGRDDLRRGSGVRLVYSTRAEVLAHLAAGGE